MDFSGNRHTAGIGVHTGVPLSPAKIGREVILAFGEGDPERPVISGLLLDAEVYRALPSTLGNQVNGERQLVAAQEEIVLRYCEASMILTAAGKVLIKRTYVLTRSVGYNKFKDAAVGLS